MTAKALYPLVGQRTAPLLQQSQMEQHYPQHRQGKDVFSTMPNDYGSLQSSDSASRTSGATIKKNTAPIVKLLPPTPSPRLELSGLGGSIDFQFSGKTFVRHYSLFNFNPMLRLASCVDSILFLFRLLCSCDLL